MTVLSKRAYSEAVSRDHGMVEVGVRLPVGPLTGILQNSYGDKLFKKLRKLLKLRRMIYLNKF